MSDFRQWWVDNMHSLPLHDNEALAKCAWQAARQSGEVEPVENQWLIQMRGEYLQTRGVWERPDHRGYTNDINEAGRYSEAAAKEAERMMPEKCKAVRLPYTHPPAPTQGVPEQAYAEAAQVINAIHGCSQHCDCGSFELAQHWRNETHGGDVWLSHCAEIQAPNQPSGEWVRCEDLARIKNLLCAMGHQGAILDAGEPPYDVGEWGIKEAQELLDLLTNQPPKDNTQEGEGDE